MTKGSLIFPLPQLQALGNLRQQKLSVPHTQCLDRNPLFDVCAIITLIAKWHNDYKVKVQRAEAFIWRHFRDCFKQWAAFWRWMPRAHSKMWKIHPSCLVLHDSVWLHHREPVSMTDRYREGDTATLKEMPFNWIMILSICMEVYLLEQASHRPFCLCLNIYLTVCLSLCMQFDYVALL